MTTNSKCGLNDNDGQYYGKMCPKVAPHCSSSGWCGYGNEYDTTSSQTRYFYNATRLLGSKLCGNLPSSPLRMELFSISVETCSIPRACVCACACVREGGGGGGGCRPGNPSFIATMCVCCIQPVCGWLKGNKLGGRYGYYIKITVNNPHPHTHTHGGSALLAWWSRIVGCGNWRQTTSKYGVWGGNACCGCLGGGCGNGPT